ncbi:MAG: hypothetical protein WCF90_08950 [Methanomicrobiales archaeon]
MDAEIMINATMSSPAGFWTINTAQFKPTIDLGILPDTMDNLYIFSRRTRAPS